MANMFDSGDRLPEDPTRIAQRLSAPTKRARFYRDVAVGEGADGFTVALDGKPIRTPGQAIVTIPSRALAQQIADEWRDQGESIDFPSMPLTRLANSVVQGVIGREHLVADDVAKYFGSDLLFYRADFPEALVEEQGKHWDPVLRWAADDLGAHFILAQGVMPVQQPESAIAQARQLLPSGAWRIGALHVIATITGSALLAVALLTGVRKAEAVWQAAHVDEDWNVARWGADEETVARRAAKRRDFDAAAFVLSELAKSG